MSQQALSNISAALLFGAPGVGKGTQGRIIHAIPGFCHLASGELFRSLDPDSDEGREAAAQCDKGELVSDDLTIRIFNRVLSERIDSSQFQPDTDMLVLDGIPRTEPQADALRDLVDVKAVISFSYSDEDRMVERIKMRATLENRTDDADEATIRRRFEVYRTETQPVLRAYPDEIISTIDALRRPLDVLRDVLDCLAAI